MAAPDAYETFQKPEDGMVKVVATPQRGMPPVMDQSEAPILDTALKTFKVVVTRYLWFRVGSFWQHYS